MEIDNNFLENFYMNQIDNPYFQDIKNNFQDWHLFHDKRHSPQLFCVTNDDVMYLYFVYKPIYIKFIKVITDILRPKTSITIKGPTIR